MKVKELIEILKTHDQDADVFYWEECDAIPVGEVILYKDNDFYEIDDFDEFCREENISKNSIIIRY